MFSPDPIRLGLVVNSCQVGDFFWSYLQPKHLSEMLQTRIALLGIAVQFISYYPLL